MAVTLPGEQEAPDEQAMVDDASNVAARRLSMGVRKPDPVDPSVPTAAERMSLHATSAFRTGTLAGPLGMGTDGKYDEFERLIREDITDEATKAEYTGLLEKWKKGDEDANEEIKDRLTAFKLMPAAKTFGDYGAAVSGALAGGIMSPETLVSPQLKVLPAVAAAAHPILNRILGMGAGQAAVNVATDPIAQALAIRAGAEDHYDMTRTLLSAPIGAVLGGAFAVPGAFREAARAHVAAEIAGRPDLPVVPPEPRAARVWEPPAAAEKPKDVEAAPEPARPVGDVAITEPVTPKVDDTPVVQVIESAGINRTDINHTDIAEAAVIHADEGLEPVQAIEMAAMRGAIRRSDVTPEQIDAIYGAGSGERIQRGPASPDGEAVGGNRQVGGGEDISGAGAVEPELLGRRVPNVREQFAQGRAENPAQAAGPIAKIASPQQAMRTLADELDAFHSDEKLKLRGAEGEYDTRTATLRLKNATDVDVFTHEIGHHVEMRAGSQLRTLNAANMQELAPLVPAELRSGLSAAEMRAEGFAEYMNRFLLSEQLAMRDAPNFTRQFKAFMQQNHPEMLKSIEKFRDAYTAWENAPSGVALRATIVNPVDLIVSAEKNTGNPMERSAFGEWLYWARQQIWDKAEALNEVVRKVASQRGGIVKASENASLALRRSSHAAQRSFETDIRYGIGGRPHEIVVDGQTKRFTMQDIIDGFTTDPRTGLHSAERHADASSYVRSRRALDLIDEFRNGEGGRTRRPDIGSYADHLNEVQRVEALYPDFRAFADMLSVVHADDVVRRWKHGLITTQERDDLLKNKTYVPFQRDMRLNESDLTSGGGTGAAGKAAAYDPIKRLKGSDRDIIDPLASFVEQMFKTNVQIRQNEWPQMLVRHIRELGPDGAGIGEEISLTDIKGNKIDVTEALAKKLTESGMPREDVKAQIDALKDTLNGSDNMVTLFRSETKGPKDVASNVLVWREGGEVKAMVLRDSKFARDLFEAYETVGKPMTDLITRFVAHGSNALRIGATGASPTFAFKNLIVDPLTRVLTDARMGRTGTALDWLPGMPFAKSFSMSVGELVRIAVTDAAEKVEFVARLAGKNLDLVDEGSAANIERALLAREGLIGQTYWQQAADATKGYDPLAQANIAPSIMDLARARSESAPALYLRVAKDYAIEAAKVPYKALKYLSEISEPAGRMAAAREVLHYELRSQGVGKSELRAFLRDPDSVPQETQGKIQGAIYEAVAGANGVADFQRAGMISTVGIARLTPFLGANLQGLAAHGETLKALIPGTTAVNRKQEVLKNERLYALWQISSLAAASFAWGYIKAYEQDERYQSVMEWQKLKNWIIPVTSELNITFPKPYEYRAYFNILEQTGAYLAGRGNEHELLRGYAKSLIDGLTPPNPFSLGPIGEIPSGIASNWDAFRKRRIVPENLEKNSPAMQSNSGTSAAANMWASTWNGLFEGMGLGDVPQSTRNSWLQVLFSPIMADYAAKSVMAGTYTDMKGMKEAATGTGFDPTSFPITRALMSKSLVYGQARSEISENVSRHGGQLTSKLEDYLLMAREPTRGDPQQFFKSMKPHEQAYVAMMAPERREDGPGVKKLHPMERAKSVAMVLSSVGRMVDQGEVKSLDNMDGFSIPDKFMRQQVRETIGRIHELEARNSLILSGDPSWKGAGYKVNEVQALYGKLEALDPRVHKEIADRYATERVVRFKTLYDPENGSGLWPDISDGLGREGGAASLKADNTFAQVSGYELEGERKKKVRPRPAPGPTR